MSGPYAFICVKTTADVVIPSAGLAPIDFQRKVSGLTKTLVGGSLTVGDLKLRPTQAAVPNHLLCDGSEISRSLFPELVEFLDPGADTATLPDYSGALVVATPTVTQTVTDSGTVSTEETTVEPAGDVGGTTGGNVTTGGRVRQAIRPGEDLP